jgi:hypothetical protein
VSRLTKIEIELEVLAAEDPIYVCLKRNLYDDEELVNVSLIPEVSSKVPLFEYCWWTKWYAFDFPGVEVIPNETYYIIIKSFNELSRRNLIWGSFSPNNPYLRGEVYFSMHQGRSWRDSSDWGGADLDTCFVTYGVE